MMKFQASYLEFGFIMFLEISVLNSSAFPPDSGLQIDLAGIVCSRRIFGLKVELLGSSAEIEIRDV